MPGFVVDRLGRLIAASAGVFSSCAARTRGLRPHLQARFGFRSRLFAAAMLAMVLAPLQSGPARAQDRLPPEFNPVTCHQLAEEAGRMIAWARWEGGYSLDKTLSGQFREDTPAWMVDLVEGWIVDAYQWQATDEQIEQSAAEVGYAGELPRAEQLNVGQTIALWMQRIARQCDRQEVRAGFARIASNKQ